MKTWIWYVLGLVVLIVVIKQCEKEPKIKIVTETEYITKTDTIKETIIRDNYIPKYIIKTVTKKGKDSVIYVDRDTDNAIVAREYDTEVKTDSASAKLKITTTGELLDVKGTITWMKEEKTTTITKIKPKSGLFLFGEVSAIPKAENFAIGLDYQIRNTFLIGVSASHNTITKGVYLNGKVGIRIF